LNKEPQKLHLFYNSKSSFIHGTEGETLETQEGQKVGTLAHTKKD
jgi:hypothetical protein